ncbi:cytochrome P450 [Hypoxylon crocopeplum]|nr:cytochrome P450 [Hypoxylon crocopeplum]
MAKWTQYFAFDIIGEVGFGDWFGNLDSATDHQQLGHWVFLTLTGHAVLGWTWLGALILDFPPIQWLLNRSLYARAKKQSSKTPLKEVLTRIITKMGSRTTDQHNNLVRDFKILKNPDGGEVHEREKMIEIANIVLAGADTTAISLRAIIYYVSSNPRVCAKLQREIDNAADLNKLSPIVTFQEAQELQYFQLVVKEALRLYPAVGYQLPRLAPLGGATVEDIYIPAGTVLGTNGWALHRNAEIYGADCEEFRPERWSDKSIDPNKTKLMEECLGSFGFGSRTCLGKNLALMEISRLIPTLFRDFNVEICYPRNPWIVTSGWFAFSSEFYVRLSTRDRAPKI